MVNALSRRNLLVSATVLGVAGCSGDIRKTSPFWSTVTNNQPKSADGDIRAYADSLAYSSMLFWFDGQSRSLVVLARSDADDRLTWYSAEREAITTFGPFIVKSLGTEVELRETVLGAGWSTDIRSLIGKTLTRRTLVSHRGAEAEAVLKSRFRDAGLSPIDVLGEKRQARRIDETLVAENRVQLTNSYWIDPETGAWLKGRQQVIPLLPPVNTIAMPRSKG
ncbi:MAG: YjbF family lipoprotein [Polymorphobacter sp.]